MLFLFSEKKITAEIRVPWIRICLRINYFQEVSQFLGNCGNAKSYYSFPKEQTPSQNEEVALVMADFFCMCVCMYVCVCVCVYIHIFVPVLWCSCGRLSVAIETWSLFSPLHFPFSLALALLSFIFIWLSECVEADTSERAGLSTRAASGMR